MMDQANQGSSSSSFANTRKRVRPHGDEGQGQHPPVASTTDENLIGQVFSGVVEGSFEAGYFLNVKVIDTEKQLKGIVFLPNKVAPLTPATDLCPQAKMYVREQQHIKTPPEAKKNQADDERKHPMDTEMRDVGVTEPEGQTLSLMPQFASSDDVPKEDHTVLTSESCEASKTAVETVTSSLEDSFAKGSTTFVDFFPAPAANVKQATGSSSSFSLELFQNESKQPGTEDERSPADAEPRGVEVKSASHVDDDDDELQLELGNKKLNASAVVTEANLDEPGSSKSGFLVNLFESREETTVKEPERSNAASKSGFLEAATQVDDDDNDS